MCEESNSFTSYMNHVYMFGLDSATVWIEFVLFHVIMLNVLPETTVYTSLTHE